MAIRCLLVSGLALVLPTFVSASEVTIYFGRAGMVSVGSRRESRRALDRVGPMPKQVPNVPKVVEDFARNGAYRHGQWLNNDSVFGPAWRPNASDSYTHGRWQPEGTQPVGNGGVRIRDFGKR